MMLDNCLNKLVACNDPNNLVIDGLQGLTCEWLMQLHTTHSGHQFYGDHLSVMQVWEVSVLWWPPVGPLSIVHVLGQSKMPCPLQATLFNWHFIGFSCVLFLNDHGGWKHLLWLWCLWTPNSSWWWLRVVMPPLLANFKHQPLWIVINWPELIIGFGRHRAPVKIWTGSPADWLVPRCLPRDRWSMVKLGRSWGPAIPMATSLGSMAHGTWPQRPPWFQEALGSQGIVDRYMAMTPSHASPLSRS